MLTDGELTLSARPVDCVCSFSSSPLPLAVSYVRSFSSSPLPLAVSCSSSLSLQSSLPIGSTGCSGRNSQN